MYMRELGEGQFGKVLLMKAKVLWCMHVNVCIGSTLDKNMNFMHIGNASHNISFTLLLHLLYYFIALSSDKHV